MAPRSWFLLLQSEGLLLSVESSTVKVAPLLLVADGRRPWGVAEKEKEWNSRTGVVLCTCV